jgi:hypothetical protein
MAARALAVLTDQDFPPTAPYIEASTGFQRSAPQYCNGSRVARDASTIDPFGLV